MFDSNFKLTYNKLRVFVRERMWMIEMESLLSIELPVGETLHIKKTRLKPINIHTGLKRISITTGIHGDELEGQYIVY